MTLTIKKGITQENTKTLIGYSRTDNVIQKFTSDSKRFASISTFNQWKKEEKPGIYTLVNEKNELEGLIWFGFKKIPEASFIRKFDVSRYGITFAIRIYAGYRGKGLAFDFMKSSYKMFVKTRKYKLSKNNKIWLRTSFDNKAAISISKKFGFIKVSDKDEEGKIIMILK